MGITRQEIARILIEDMKWSDPKWSKRTGITRQTFWRLRKQDYANIESKTLELMARAAGKKLEWNDMNKVEASIVDEAFKFDGSEVTVSALTQLLIDSQQTAIELLKKLTMLWPKDLGQMGRQLAGPQNSINMVE